MTISAEEETNDQTERYTSVAHKAWTLRGFIINETIFLERLIDEYLGRHFCKDPSKKEELFELILASDRITFESKRQILKYLIEKHDKTFLENNKTIFSDLSKIIEERNIMAHQLLNSSGDAYERADKEIGFMKFKNSSSELWYNQEKIDHIKELTDKYIKLFIAKLKTSE